MVSFFIQNWILYFGWVEIVTLLYYLNLICIENIDLESELDHQSIINILNYTQILHNLSSIGWV